MEFPSIHPERILQRREADTMDAQGDCDMGVADDGGLRRNLNDSFNSPDVRPMLPLLSVDTDMDMGSPGVRTPDGPSTAYMTPAKGQGGYFSPQSPPSTRRPSAYEASPPGGRIAKGRGLPWAALLSNRHRANSGCDLPPPKFLRRESYSDAGPEECSRFDTEYMDRRLIGEGHFSAVYRARHKVDGCEYAIKRCKKGSAPNCRYRTHKEAEAIATLNCVFSPYIVRYFDAWVEDGRLHIRTELCDTNLRQLYDDKRKMGLLMVDDDLRLIIKHVAGGLARIHGATGWQGVKLVHLDIKPENILCKLNKPAGGIGPPTVEAYKIADFGLAIVAVEAESSEVTEGDARYLAKEVLRGEFEDLRKADVFSLGAMCFELASGCEMPINGDLWHELRDQPLHESRFCGVVAAPDGFNHTRHAGISPEMVALIRNMMLPASLRRPSCEKILASDVIQAEEVENQLKHMRALKMHRLLRHNSVSGCVDMF